MNMIRARRRAMNMTMKELANIIGVSEGAVSHYETGRREPDPHTLGRIANALNVSVDFLLGREGSKNDAQKEKSPADKRAEAKAMLESMTDEQYQSVLQYLKFLKSQQEG